MARTRSGSRRSARPRAAFRPTVSARPTAVARPIAAARPTAVARPIAAARPTAVARPRAAFRPTVVLIAVVVAVLAGALVGAPPAPAHGRAANGCTGVPDSGYGFEFHHLCDRHDRCYRTRPYGSSSAGRRSCDRVFRAQMLWYCRRHRAPSAKRTACRAVAAAYYGGVRALGHRYWAGEAATPIA